MSNPLLKVKTRKQASAWSYSVVNGTGQTIASRRGFATETKARDAGHAAVFALTPAPISLRHLRIRQTAERPVVAITVAPKPFFLRSLFG